jgi:hypothetical protein
MYGSDIEALRRLGEMLEQSAQALESQIAVIGGQVQGVPWFGPSGGMFEDEWASLHLPGMRAAVLGLRTAGQAAARNADAQEETSSNSEGAGSGSGYSGGSDASGSIASGNPGSGSSGGTTQAFVTTAGDDTGSWPGAGSDDDDETAPQGPVPLGDRKPPGEILSEYQVSDDKMKDWKPSGAGAWIADKLGQVDLDEMEPRTITEKEAEMLDDLSIFEKKSFQEIHDQAFDEADDRYPSEDRNDDHNDAFRHAYWNALMADEYGDEWAHDYGTAHERIPGNNAAREAMDLYNNEVGRQIAQENPDASREDLARLVAQAVDDGRMVVVAPDGQSLVYSDQIASSETGDAGESPAAQGKDPKWQDES